MSSITLGSIIGNTKLSLPFAVYNISSIAGSNSTTLTNNTPIVFASSSTTLVNSSTGTSSSPFGSWTSKLIITVAGLYRCTITGPRVYPSNGNMVITFTPSSGSSSRTMVSSQGTGTNQSNLFVPSAVWEGVIPVNGTLAIQISSDSSSGVIIPEGTISLVCVQAL